MGQIKYMINLLRPKHYLKNSLILVPLFFDLNILTVEFLFYAVLGVIIFSLLSSLIYIINDLNDLEYDKKSETKRNRPLAAGTVSVVAAKRLIILLVVFILFFNIPLHGKGALWLFLYFVLNLAYSIKLKQIPIVDVVILASGFLIRLLYGATITNIHISFWLCITVISFSFYMGLGKRRNELANSGGGMGDSESIETLQ